MQSAFFSFWRRAVEGEWDQEMHRENLWGLLGVITVRKAAKQARRERAQKRGAGRVFNETSAPAEAGDEFRLDAAELRGAREAFQQLPAEQFDLACEDLLLLLDEEMRFIALHKLMGYTQGEIAALLGCTVRKVERKTALIRQIWAAEGRA